MAYFIFNIFCHILSFNIIVGFAKWPSEISVGLLNKDFDQSFYYLTVNQTVFDLKSNGVVPQNVYFRFQQISACDDLSSINASLRLWFIHKASIIFGPECSAGMMPVGLMAASLNKPIIGYISVTNDLNDKTKYSTLVRISSTMSSMFTAIASVLTYYNWKTVSIVQHQETCSMITNGLDGELEKWNITITNNLEIGSSTAVIKNTLTILQATARVIILCNGSSPATVGDFLKVADQMDMNTPDFVYITPFYFRSSWSPWEPWLQPRVNEATANIYKNAFRNALVISTKAETNTKLKEFSKRLQAIVANNSDEFPNEFKEDYATKLGQLRDAVYLHGVVLNQTIERGLSDISGTEFFQAASGITMKNGVTGKVILDENAERIPSYLVSKFNKTGVFEPFLRLSGTPMDESKTFGVDSLLAEPFWNTTDNIPPDHVPSCEFENEFCPKDTSYIQKLAVGIPVSVALVIAFLFWIISSYRKRTFERHLLQMTWKIDPTHLNTIFKPTSLLTASIRSQSWNNPNFDGPDIDSPVKFGIYKGNVVVVKHWRRISHVTLSRDHLLRLNCIKDLNHENVNKFVGLSIESENLIFCLWSYCSRRSLQEIVHNEDVHLDATFKVSILRDIVSGLDYLHSSAIEYHGSLNITNCVVDSRWVVKLTDFGLKPILDELYEKKIIIMEYTGNMDKMLCMPPEVLRNSSPITPKRSDIYQFAMVAYHVLYRDEPYADFHLTTEDILTIIKKEPEGKAAVRPTLKSLEGLNFEIKDLISLCWHENPTVRPTASELKKEIFSRTNSFGKNVMDHMMNMLEKYATNLEKIVDERTTQLNEERNRADRLLFQILPKTVAVALKSGLPVNPETFDCVTIYFSDIVGFTDICSDSTPVEVVSMLNTLYSHFDAIILKFNCYKVETIGDAYLVAGGLPERNGDQHVRQVADLSLEILKILQSYEIPHIPGRLLQIRIGLHSGPVAAGVVGLTLPKYCLFGDTVNLASRMESTGEPGKIHITEDTKKLLLKHEFGYITQRRGSVEVKGKGKFTTYWLLDKVDGKFNG